MHGLFQAGGLHGFEQVVHGLRLEGLQGVLVVRGDEHQRGEGRFVGRPGVGQGGGGVQAALAGHADVEEQHLGPQRQRFAHGREAVAHGGGHAQFGPGPGQCLLQCRGQQRFVLSDQGAWRCRWHIAKEM